MTLHRLVGVTKVWIRNKKVKHRYILVTIFEAAAAKDIIFKLMFQ